MFSVFCDRECTGLHIFRITFRIKSMTGPMCIMMVYCIKMEKQVSCTLQSEKYLPDTPSTSSETAK
jgi:hypothetical protein